MPKITIKTHPELFNECRMIASKVKSLSAVVQNDMEVIEEDFQGWRSRNFGIGTNA